MSIQEGDLVQVRIGNRSRLYKITSLSPKIRIVDLLIR